MLPFVVDLGSGGASIGASAADDGEPVAEDGGGEATDAPWGRSSRPDHPAESVPHPKPSEVTPRPMSSLHPYASLGEVHDTAASLGRAAGGRVEVYGRSVEGRDLVAVELPGDGPVVMVTAGIHGLEFIGVHTALAVLRAGPLRGARLRVCPVLNPDAYMATHEGHRRRINANGVDLNRNFPLPWSARPSPLGFLGAGSDRPGDLTYRGAGPLSEPETRALAALVAELQPHASANLHSFLGTLFCARVWHPSDWLAYRRLAQVFRQGQGSGLRYRRIGTPVFDVFTGELEDWQHHAMRCWAVCVECFALTESLGQQLRAPDPFWRFNPRDPEPISVRDAAGVRAMLEASVGMERPPEREGAAVVRGEW